MTVATAQRACHRRPGAASTSDYSSGRRPACEGIGDDHEREGAEKQRGREHVPPEPIEWYAGMVNGTFQVTMGDRGRLVIPVELRTQAGLTEGTPVVLIATPGGVPLVSREQLKSLVRDLVGLDLVPELLADRRRRRPPKTRRERLRRVRPARVPAGGRRLCGRRDETSAGGTCGTANWAEVAQKVRAHGRDWDLARALLASYGLHLEPVSVEDAEQAAVTWTSGSSLSLADRYAWRSDAASTLSCGQRTAAGEAGKPSGRSADCAGHPTRS